tara:strand:+ start:877 stop:1518 length:642 start_codon:yes stop_codon:yes gene_type:complete
MSSNTDIINILYNSRETIMEMLKHRGYDTSEYSNFSYNEIKLMYTEKQLDINVKNSENKQISMYYLIYKKERNQSLNNFLEEKYEEFTEDNDDFEPANNSIIIILKDKPNQSLQKIVDDFYARYKLYVQLFFVESLQRNILNHEYVPIHEILTEDEFSNQVKNVYKLSNRYQLPLIDRCDPVAKFIGMKPGTVCKITRPSETSGQYISYRCCK